jgi:luciferase family oxidoreductase group 1
VPHANSIPLKLSVLDQSPISAGHTAAEALQNSIALARHVDALGFTRFWMSEHHAMDTLACTAPEIMLARLGAETSRIRLGSGGIMLPHYSAFKVAEVFRTLHALYPNRIDLGLGRAPGGGPTEALALQRDRQSRPGDDFAEQVTELLAWFQSGQPGITPDTDQTFPPNHPFAKVRVSPWMPGYPDLWMLGSSMWSAAAASQFGLPYAFAHFFSPVHTRAAIESYQRAFLPSNRPGAETGRPGARTQPEATLAVGVICADTQAEADFLHASVRLLQRRIRLGDRSPIAAPADAIVQLAQLDQPRGFDIAVEEGEWPRYFVGPPARVGEQLRQMASALNLSEIIVNTIAWDPAARRTSYTLLAREFNLA